MVMTLSDGTVIEDLVLNGNNYVSQTELNENMFDGKLEEVTVEDEGNTVTLHNCELVYIRQYNDGWYFVLREMTAEEIKLMQLEAQVFFTAMSTDSLMEEE